MESNIEEIKIFAENVKFFNRLTTDVFERVGLTKTNLFLTLKSASSLQRRLCRQNNDFIDNTVLPLLKKETPLSKDEKNYLTSLALSLYNADEKRFDDPCFTAEIWEKLVNDRLAAYRKTHSEKVLAEMIRGLIYHYYSVLDTASTVFFKWSVALFEKIFALNILPKASDIKNKKLVHDIVRAVCGFYPCMVHNSVCMLSTEDSARALDTVFAASSALCDAFLGDGDDRLRNADTVEYYRKDFLSSSVRHRLTSGLGGAEHIEEAKKIITETLPYIPVDLRAVITDGAPFPSNAKHIKFIDDVLSTFYDLFFLAYYTGAITEKNYYDGLCSFGEFVVKYTAKDRHGYFISATLELLKILEKDSLKLDGE
ncbi:MAG: hypothetical protein LBN25_04565, partial [Christensenellaceae bacterium]|nr:hypothetical protein [Christensenellaceae bacterium]